MKKVKIATIVLILAAGSALATDESVAITKGSVRAEDGVRLVYDVRGKGDTALVFIHGWACNRSFWHEQVDNFAQQYYVVSVDLGGHGEFQANRDVWSIAAFGGDVKVIVEQLDLAEVVLIGHSMGGMVALECARLMPKRVVGIVGVETLHDAEFVYNKEMTKKAVENFKSDFRGTMTSFVRSAFVEGTNPNLIDWVVSKACAANQEAALGVILEMPNLDGFGLTEKIREDDRFEALPVVALTTLAADEDMKRGKAVGIDEYHIKLDKERLMDSVRNYLKNGRSE